MFSSVREKKKRRDEAGRFRTRHRKHEIYIDYQPPEWFIGLSLPFVLLTDVFF